MTSNIYIKMDEDIIYIKVYKMSNYKTRSISKKEYKWFMIDAVDYDRVKSFKWFYTTSGYAMTVSYGKEFMLHRVVLQVIGNCVVDHINGNKQDNRKSNLRVATSQQNSWNVKIKNNKYRCVSKSGKNYCVTLTHNKKRYSFKGFTSNDQAAFFYNCIIRILRGKFAVLNDTKYFDVETMQKAQSEAEKILTL